MYKAHLYRQQAGAFPSLDLPFSISKSLDPRITFTRAGSGTYFDASGVLQTATTDEPRFDHNPVTGESLGLLVEGAATNLLTYSEEFDNANWTKTDVTVTADVFVAPDGTATADKIIPDATTTFHRSLQNPDLLSGSVYTYSCYFHAAEFNYGYLYVDSAAEGRIFNLADGTLGSVIIGAPDESTISDAGNGWYKCSITVTVGVGASGTWAGATNSASSANILGDGVSGIYIWGAQLETGSRASSYIKTVASTVTRAADSASMTGTNFSSWYNAAEGTFVVEVAEDYSTTAASRGWMTAHDGTLANSINMYHSAGSLALDFYSGGAQQVAFNPTYSTKAALAYAPNGSAGSGGGSLETDSVCVVPVGINQLIIGNTYASYTYPMNGCIKRLTYYPRRLTNGNLQELTS